MRSNQNGNLQKLQLVRGSRVRQNVLQIKNNLKNYLNHEGGSVSGQLYYVRITTLQVHVTFYYFSFCMFIFTFIETSRKLTIETLKQEGKYVQKQQKRHPNDII